jgi:hypothetical protein
MLVAGSATTFAAVARRHRARRARQPHFQVCSAGQQVHPCDKRYRVPVSVIVADVEAVDVRRRRLVLGLAAG